MITSAPPAMRWRATAGLSRAWRLRSCFSTPPAVSCGGRTYAVLRIQGPACGADLRARHLARFDARTQSQSVLQV